MGVSYHLYFIFNLIFILLIAIYFVFLIFFYLISSLIIRINFYIKFGSYSFNIFTSLHELNFVLILSLMI